MLSLNSDARHICTISEAVAQYCFYYETGNDLEGFNSFALLVAIKGNYRDALGRLLGDEPAIGSQLETPAAGANLKSKLQTLAENLASGLTGERTTGYQRIREPAQNAFTVGVGEKD